MADVGVPTRRGEAPTLVRRVTVTPDARSALASFRGGAAFGDEVVERRKRRHALELHDVELRAVQEQQRSLALLEHRALDRAARRVRIGHAVDADAARADERLVRMEAADERCGFGAEDRTFARRVVAGAQDDAAAIAAAQRIGDRKAVGDARSGAGCGRRARSRTGSSSSPRRSSARRRLRPARQPQRAIRVRSCACTSPRSADARLVDQRAAGPSAIRSLQCAALRELVEIAPRRLGGDAEHAAPASRYARCRRDEAARGSVRAGPAG